MRRLVLLVIALAMVNASGAVAPAIAESDSGKRFAVGAFQSTGTGGAVLEFGDLKPANLPARDHWDSVRIFGYTEDGYGPSQGQVYCGEVWNVIVTVDFEPFRDWFVGNFATQAIDDGDPFVVESKTPVRQNRFGLLTQVHGTFLPPGTLGEGEHTVKQTLEHPMYGVFWDPDPVTIYVDNTTC